MIGVLDPLLGNHVNSKDITESRGGWNGLWVGVQVPVLIITLIVFTGYLSLSCEKVAALHGGESRAASCPMVTRTLVWDGSLLYLRWTRNSEWTGNMSRKRILGPALPRSPLLPRPKVFMTSLNSATCDERGSRIFLYWRNISWRGWSEGDILFVHLNLLKKNKAKWGDSFLLSHEKTATSLKAVWATEKV